MSKIKLGEFEVAGLGDLEVVWRAGNYRDFNPGSFEQAGFVCSDEGVGGGLVEGALEQAEACSLGCLGLDDSFARNCAGDDGSVGGAFDLLDRVDGRETDDGGSVACDGVDGTVDGGGVDERTDSVVDENDVVRNRVDRVESVGNGVLAGVPTFDDADPLGKAVLVDLGL